MNSRTRRDEYLARAKEADEQAEKVTGHAVKASLRNIAESYRALAAGEGHRGLVLKSWPRSRPEAKQNASVLGRFLEPNI